MDAADLVEKFNQGVVLHNQGHSDQALTIYNEVLQLYPQLAMAQHHAGMIHWERGDKALALDMLRKAVALEPREPSYRHSLLLRLMQFEKPFEATQVLEDGAAMHGYGGRNYVEWSMTLSAERQKLLQSQILPLPDVEDPEFYSILARCWPYSMSSVYGMVDAFYSLYETVRYITKYKIPGDIVECGVYAGGMTLLAALTLLHMGDTSRDIYLYDTYEGMPPPTPEDGAEVQAAYERNTAGGKAWAPKSLEEVTAVLYASGYPREKLHFVKGMVEDTIPAVGPERISILRIDTDFYSSVGHVLREFYPRLSSGGSLILDDYGYMPGARQATDEYFAGLDRPMLFNRVNLQVRAGVKP